MTWSEKLWSRTDSLSYDTETTAHIVLCNNIADGLSHRQRQDVIKDVLLLLVRWHYLTHCRCSRFCWPHDIKTVFEESTNVCDLHFYSTTLKLECVIDIYNVCSYTKNKAAVSQHIQKLKLKPYVDNFHGQSSPKSINFKGLPLDTFFCQVVLISDQQSLEFLRRQAERQTRPKQYLFCQ